MHTALQDVIALQRVKRYYAEVDQSNRIVRTTGQLRTDEERVADIAKLFADNAVYERRTNGTHDCYAGHDAIAGFFSNQRTLVGSHDIQAITAQDGMGGSVAEAVKKHFPTLDAKNCTTVSVKGSFNGIKSFVNDVRQLNSAATTTLPFEDDWVFADGKVIYRHSNIMPTPHQASPRERF